MKENVRIMKFNIEAAAWAGVRHGSNLAEAFSFGARSYSGSTAGCNLEMGIKPPKGEVICRNGGYKNTFGVHINKLAFMKGTISKRLTLKNNKNIFKLGKTP